MLWNQFVGSFNWFCDQWFFGVLRLTKRKKRTAGSREIISTRISIYWCIMGSKPLTAGKMIFGDWLGVWTRSHQTNCDITCTVDLPPKAYGHFFCKDMGQHQPAFDSLARWQLPGAQNARKRTQLIERKWQQPRRRRSSQMPKYLGG